MILYIYIYCGLWDMICNYNCLADNSPTLGGDRNRLDQIPTPGTNS